MSQRKTHLRYRVPGNVQQLLLQCVLPVIFIFTMGQHASAGILTHTFAISGDNGETGSGTFTWDDTLVSSGSPVSNSLVNLGNIISLNIEISNGNIVGSSTVFTASDCVGAYLVDSPDFLTDINFFCNNGVNTLSGFDRNINYLNDTADFGAGLIAPVLGPSSSTLTFSSGTTSPVASGSTNSIPATPWWVLVGLSLLMTRLVHRRNYMAGRACNAS